MNATVPVGLAPLPVTLAVNVTAWPTLAGFFDEASVVVDGVVVAVCTKLTTTVQLAVTGPAV